MKVVLIGFRQDFKAFLDFLLAAQNKDTPQGLAYYWKVLDIDKLGYITLPVLQCFYKSLAEKSASLEMKQEFVKSTDLMVSCSSQLLCYWRLIRRFAVE